MKFITFITIISVLFLFSCSNNSNNCELIGTWKSIEFYSDRPIDVNKDGVFNKDLLKEYECTEVIFNFKKGGRVERLYKSEKTGCKFKKSTFSYTVNGNQILFTINGMKQKQRFNIHNCKLHFYGVKGSYNTKNGRKEFLINSVFKKE